MPCTQRFCPHQCHLLYKQHAIIGYRTLRPYPNLFVIQVFLKMVRVKYLELRLGSVLMLGLGVMLELRVLELGLQSRLATHGVRNAWVRDG